MDVDGVIRYQYFPGENMEAAPRKPPPEMSISTLRSEARALYEECPADDFAALLDRLFTRYPTWMRNAVV